MSFGEYEESFDYTLVIQPSDWRGSLPDLWFPIVPPAPNNGETELEQFGHGALNAIGGNSTRFGLRASGRAVGGYDEIPVESAAGVAVQLGTVSVPVITQRVRFTGQLELHLLRGTSAPTSGLQVRVKGTRGHRRTFRDEMLARFQPKPTPAQKVGAVLRRFVGLQ